MNHLVVDNLDTLSDAILSMDAAFKQKPNMWIAVDVRFMPSASYLRGSESLSTCCPSHLSVLHITLDACNSFTFDYQQRELVQRYREQLLGLFNRYTGVKLMCYSNPDTLGVSPFVDSINCSIQSQTHTSTSMFTDTVTSLLSDFQTGYESQHVRGSTQFKSEFFDHIISHFSDLGCLFPFVNSYFSGSWKGPMDMVWDYDALKDVDWAARPLPQHVPVALSLLRDQMLNFKRTFSWYYISSVWNTHITNQGYRDFHAGRMLLTESQEPIWRSPSVESFVGETVGRNDDFVIEDLLDMCSTGDGHTRSCYFGTHKDTLTKVFIKIDSSENSDSISNEVSKLIELQLYCELGFPRLVWFGRQGVHNVLITENIGPSLSCVLTQHKVVPLKDVLAIALQLTQRISFLHHLGLFHRDIKPSNICLARDPIHRQHKVFLIDFETCISIDAVETNRVGTFDYMSLNVHARELYSWFDDLESMGYVLIKLAKGALPWKRLSKKQMISQHGKATRRIYEREIQASKQQTDSVVLCSDLPIEFEMYMEYVRNQANAVLRFERSALQKPDYRYIYGLWKAAATRLGFNIKEHQLLTHI